MNNEVGQSLAVVRWGPQLLHSWLLKLIVSPLSTVSSCLQKTNPIRWDAVIKVAEMGDRKHQLELASCDGCLYYAASCLQLTSKAGLKSVLVSCQGVLKICEDSDLCCTADVISINEPATLHDRKNLLYAD